MGRRALDIWRDSCEMIGGTKSIDSKLVVSLVGMEMKDIRIVSGTVQTIGTRQHVLVPVSWFCL